MLKRNEKQDGLFVLLFLFNGYNRLKVIRSHLRPSILILRGLEVKTKTIQEIKALLTKHKNELAEKYGVMEIGIFGSYLREEQKETSDIDILVEFKNPVGMLTFVNLKNHLSDLFGVNVDLVMKKALKPGIGKRILSEVVYV
jgi:uncharacterized protein